MIIKSYISELNTLCKNGATEYREKIDNMIDLYKDKQITNFRAARHDVISLAVPTGYTRKKHENNVMI